MRVVKSISLPSDLVDFLNSCVRQGGYISLSEYLRELIRAHKEEKLAQELKESEADFKAGRLAKARSLRDLKK